MEESDKKIPELVEIQRRLERDKLFRVLLNTEKTGSQKMEDIIRRKSTNTARSEHSITPESSNLLELQMQQIREELIQNGLDFTNYSQYTEMLENDEITKERALLMRTRENPDYTVTIDTANQNYFQFFSFGDEDGTVIIFTVRNEGDFNIHIYLPDSTDEEKQVEYYSYGDSIDDLTTDEFRILSHYFDRYTESLSEEISQSDTTT